MVKAARQIGARTYLQPDSNDAQVDGCRNVGSHPMGVEIIFDGLFNGYSELLDCGNYWKEVGIFDVAYPTTSSMATPPAAGAHRGRLFFKGVRANPRWQDSAIDKRRRKPDRSRDRHRVKQAD